jgi:uncharacterized protein YbbC (DUF1343 family)
MRSLTQALLYPGIGLLETTNISVGRGTDRPFEWIGAPWLDGRRLAAALAQEKLPGVRFVPLNITPVSSTHKGKECGGMQIFIDSWKDFEPVRTGMTIATTLRKLYPNDWKTDRYNVLLCHTPTLEGIRNGADWRTLVARWQSDLAEFRMVRDKYLIYR